MNRVFVDWALVFQKYIFGNIFILEKYVKYQNGGDIL